MRVFRNAITYDPGRSETGEQLMREWIELVKCEHGPASYVKETAIRYVDGRMTGIGIELVYEHLEEPKEAA